MIWILIFGVFYPLMWLAVMMACFFSIPLMRPTWREQVIHQITDHARYKAWCNTCIHDIWVGETKVVKEVLQVIFPPHIEHRIKDWYVWPYFWKFLFGGLIWPITIPIYLAWKKGDMYAQLGTKNDQLTQISERILVADANLKALEAKQKK